MVAAAILLYERFTFGTVLGVGGDPILCFRYILNFFLPHFHLFTVGRKVRFLLTMEAESEATTTSHKLSFHHFGRDHIPTVGSRAPFEFFVLINKGLGEEGEVFLVQIIGDQTLDGILVNDGITLVRRATYSP
jgi:hypothetical protein